MGLLIDAHTHLFPPLRPFLVQEVVTYLKATGNSAIVMSIDTETSIETLRLGESFPSEIHPFVGIHPGHASMETLGSLKDLVEAEPGFTGLGEIGLDGTYTDDAIVMNRQRSVFDQMLLIAEKMQKPVSVHSRGAVEETLSTLKRFNLNKVMLHWFAGTQPQLREAQKKGYYISFGPSCVYSRKVQRLARISDPEMTLVESDGPVRFSACFEGHSADPRMIASVVNGMALIWGLTYSETASILAKNTLTYLNVL